MSETASWTGAVLGATVLAACLGFSTDIADFADVPKRSVVQAGVWLAAGVWLLRDAREGVSTPAGRWVVPVFVAFWVLAGVGLLRASDRYRALETWLHWTTCLGAGWLALQACAHVAERRRLAQWIGGAGLAVAAIGVAQHHGWVSLAPESAPPASTFGNRNWAAQALVPCLPLIAVLGLVSRSAAATWLWAGAAALVVAQLAAIASTAAVLAVGAQLVVGGGLLWADPVLRPQLAASLRRGAAPLATAALATVGLVIAAPGVPDGTTLRGEAAGLLEHLEPGAPPAPEATAGRTIADRLGNYRAALVLIARRPLLGHGLQRYAAIFPAVNGELGDPTGNRLRYEQGHTHNDWLQLGVELGAPAALLLLAAALWGLVALARAARRGLPGSSEVRALRLGAALGLVGLGVHAAFSYPLYNAVPPFLAMLLAALCAAEGARVSAWPAAAGRPAVRATVCAVWIAVAFPWLGWRSDVWRIEHDMARLLALVETGEWAAVGDWAEALGARDRGRRDYLVYRAQAEALQQRPQAALGALDGLLAVYPDHPAGLALRASVLAAAGRRQDACRSYERLLFVVPREARFYEPAVECWLASGRPDEARALVRRGLVHPEVRAGLGPRAGRLAAELAGDTEE